MVNMEDFHVDTWNIVSSEVHYGFAVVGIGPILGHHVLAHPRYLYLHTRTKVHLPSLAYYVALARRAARYNS